MRLVLEGISGAGKSLQASMLADRLKSSATTAIVTEFSAGLVGQTALTAYSQNAERFVRLHSSESFADQTHLLLLADTVAKSEEIALSRAGVVLIDRLFDSWLCYTLAATGRRVLTNSTVWDLYWSCTGTLRPCSAVTIFLEIDVTTAARRLARRDGKMLDPHERWRLEAIASNYADLYARVPVVRVDAMRPMAEVTSAIIAALRLKL